MISIREGKSFNFILVLWIVLRRNILRDTRVEFLKQGLIVLQVTCSSMKAQDTHEKIFVVGQVGHRLDVINMGML
jgi:hypothetical protein